MSLSIPPKFPQPIGNPVTPTQEFDQMCACWINTTRYAEKPVTLPDPVTGGTMTLFNANNLPTKGLVPKLDEVTGTPYWEEVKSSQK